jgi:formate-dependent nitrite reductase membrane component NrfD
MNWKVGKALIWWGVFGFGVILTNMAMGVVDRRVEFLEMMIWVACASFFIASYLENIKPSHLGFIEHFLTKY